MCVSGFTSRFFQNIFFFFIASTLNCMMSISTLYLLFYMGGATAQDVSSLFFIELVGFSTMALIFFVKQEISLCNDERSRLGDPVESPLEAPLVL